MIKNLYIHIGYPKAASSSIQMSLGKSSELLKKNGYLYPVFNIFGVKYSNHSIFFHNLFANAPQPSNVNLRNQITTEEKQYQFIDQFKKQLQEQLKSFKGENLILSGEGIIHLKTDGVRKMKEFFINLLGIQCNFCLIVVTRNPTSRIPSNMQQRVREGGVLSFERIFKTNTLFSHTLSVFLEHFSVSNFRIIRLEDTSSNRGGIIARLLNEVGLPPELIDKVPNVHINEKLSYEAVLILSAINKKIPFKVDGKLNPQRSSILLEDFHKIPGTKFQITEQQKIAIWKNSLNDTKWLSEKFNCPTYEFAQNSLKANEIVVKWDTKTLYAISLLLKKQDKAVKKIIIKGMFSYIWKHKNQYKQSRRMEIYYYLATEWKKSIFNN